MRNGFKIISVRNLNFLKFIFAIFIFISCSDEQVFVNELKQIAADVNKKCPQMIDSETKLDGLEVIEPNTLVYKYTLVNLNTMSADTHAFYNAMWPGILSYIKVSKDMQKLRDNNTILHYLYNDKNNHFFYLFKVNPKDYNPK